MTSSPHDDFAFDTWLDGLYEPASETTDVRVTLRAPARLSRSRPPHPRLVPPLDVARAPDQSPDMAQRVPRAEVEPTSGDLDAALVRLGYAAFRAGQREAIVTLLTRGRLLLVAPTGGGKSLTYQLPATVLRGTTVVVSPLIALMHDQVTALAARGVRATYLASTLEGGEVGRRMAALGRGDYDLVYVAPERLGHHGLAALLGSIEVPLIAIDEAHCISEWGHDFRPDYLAIGRLLERLPRARVLACTATATPVVRDEILERLGLPADTPQVVHGFARPNLALRASEAESARDRRAWVDALLHEALGAPAGESGTAIIYAPTRAAVEQEAARLAGLGHRAAAYHAGLDGATRERVQSGFMQGRTRVIVATNAFGMGIDRPDVRAVVHLAPPGSIEAYYQEVGRAGRDGERAIGLVLHGSGDLAMRRRLLEMPLDGRLPEPAVVEHKWSLFLELLRWIEGGSCRHDAILRYFGAAADVLDGCGRCDECERGADDDAAGVNAEEVALVVRKALSGVARVQRRLGLGAAVKLLAGQADERLARWDLEGVATFGVLRDRDEAWLLRLLRRCITAGWVGFTGDERPLCVLTGEGRAVMLGHKPARLVLPPDVIERPRPPRSAGGHAGAPNGRAGAMRSGARRAGGDRRGGEPTVLDDAALDLFEALRAHRLEVARSEGVPPYVVASDRTLRDIALLRPRTPAELLLAHGIGPTKAERYGAGLLAVITRGAGAAE